MIEFHVPERNMECKKMTRLSPCFHILDQICYEIYMKNSSLQKLQKFQARIYIYILNIPNRLALLVSNQ